MTGTGISPEQGAELWQAIAGGGVAGRSADLLPAAVSRFSELASAALTDELLGGGVIDADTVSQSRLNNRFALAAQRACLMSIAAAGIPVVAMKGFALAHTLYRDPSIRAVGDLDVLVPEAHRNELLRHLTHAGYTFEPLARPPWGFISEASYAPFVSADSTCNLDVHIHPDCYPAYVSLTTADVFAEAQTVRDGDLEFLATSLDHAFLLCATNAAKDKFGPFAARKIADGMRLATTRSLDWERLDRIAAAGRFGDPFRVFVRLLGDLGVDPAVLPPDWDAVLPRRARKEYVRMLRETQALYPGSSGLAATLRRELLLSTEPPVGLRNAWSRIRGLFVRQTGVPATPAGW